MNTTELRTHARDIWQAAVAAAQPSQLLPPFFTEQRTLRQLSLAERILVVGAGKAGAAMTVAVEEALGPLLAKVQGVVNVPAPSPGTQLPTTQRIRLHIARPAGSNQPTAEGVVGADEMLRLLASAGPEDVALCLLSGGGSALLPAPVEGVALADKQAVTKLLHACGATINEMNAVRKHLSRIKGGRLAQAFTGTALFSLIISDVIGDPLDVIASGPTAADPTTFADALAILQRFELLAQVPTAVRTHLERGQRGELPETLKSLPAHVHNLVLANCTRSLSAAQARAEQLGYRVHNLGAFIEGETRQAALVLAGIVRSLRRELHPLAPPVCVLSGGETTVTLAPQHGLGGRNQEMILAMAHKLGVDELANVVLLSGGTDGEDGPTDAAGAIADVRTLQRAEALQLDAAQYLARNDAYHFFEWTGDLLKTGLTQTNVMDVRVFLIGA